MKRPTIKVAFCITELEVGGAERTLVRLACELKRSARFEPVVYCLDVAPREEQAGLVDLLRAAKVEVQFLGGQTPWAFPRVIARLARGLRRQRPDVLQTFLFHANLLGAVAARWAKVPQVISGIRVVEPDRPWRMRFLRFVERWIDRHVCVSGAVAQNAAAWLDKDKLIVIPNGVDVLGRSMPGGADHGGLAAQGHQESAGRRAIVFAGRLTTQKGLDRLLPHLPQVFAAEPMVDLLVLGRGPERKALEQRCRDLGIDGRVRFLGWRADARKWIEFGDLLVLPSRWEGMPNVVLEAMAAGKPVVATAAEGVSELLGSGDESQIVPQDDFALFPGRILALLGNPDLRRQLGEQNRTRVEQCFSSQEMFAAYARLYEQMVDA